MRGRVLGFVEKPPVDEAPTNWINAGTYVFEPSVLDRIDDYRKVSVERETFPQLVESKSLWAVQSDVYWVDSGTPATYLEIQLDLLDGVRGEAVGGVAVDASIAGDAVVERSVVMSDATVEQGAIVRNAAIQTGATIGSRAVVEGSIVGPGALIGSGAKVVGGSIIGNDAVVEAGASLCDARIPESD